MYETRRQHPKPHAINLLASAKTTVCSMSDVQAITPSRTNADLPITLWVWFCDWYARNAIS